MKAEDAVTDKETETTNDASTIPFDEPLEVDEKLDLAPNLRVILTEQGDPEVESLYRKYKCGRLVIQPDFQRQFVWDQSKSSRLIESALLRIPLPVIYLAQESDGKEQVIDGQQRLTAFFSFLDGKFPSGADFRLTGLKVFTELSGKHFSELSEEDQGKIRFSKIRTIIFLPQSDPELRFEVFERLNTGAVSLNDQELRNCMYRGSYNNLLKRLSRNEDFSAMMNLTRSDKRMKDVELVLRFGAFFHSTYLNYQAPMRRFLNSDMEQYRNMTAQQAKDFEEAFKKAVSLVRSMLGEHAFKRYYRGTKDAPDGRWEPKKFNSSLYDVLMWTMARADRNMVMRYLDALREAYIDLLSNDDTFIESIQLSTSSVKAVNTRFHAWHNRMQAVLAGARPESRCFTLALKQQLFNANPVCGICGNRIQVIDDSAVDHIDQYWQGGRTIPENARLAHRYCNLARPRKE